jgi:hypothetical protein
MITYCFYLEEEVEVEKACAVCGKGKLCDMLHEFVQNEFKYEEEIKKLKEKIEELQDDRDRAYRMI